MKTKTEQFDYIAKVCRQNTGKHFLDSGDFYGRHYDRAIPAKPVTFDVFIRKGETPDITCTISLIHWLDEGFNLDTELQQRFDEWAPEQEGSWFELGERFASDVLGMHQHARDNVCNAENEFDQVFVWEVWTPNEEERDWVYADDALCVIYPHTGCDVRGGYAQPLFLRSNNDSYAMQLDWVAQVYAVSGVDDDGDELSDTQLRSIDEHWQCGYSSLPSNEFCEDVLKVRSFEDCGDRIKVTLKTGETIEACASMPYLQ